LSGVTALPLGTTMADVNAFLQGVDALPVGTSIDNVNAALSGLNTNAFGASILSIRDYLTGINVLPVGTSVEAINAYLSGINALPVGTTVAQANAYLSGVTALPLGTTMADVNAFLQGVDALPVGTSIAAVNAALGGVNTETFVATITLAFQNLAARISTVLSDINSERIAVREAAIQILNPTVMTKGAINAGIGAINTTLPGSAGVTAAAASLTASQARVVAAAGASVTASAKMATDQSYFISKVGELYALANSGGYAVNSQQIAGGAISMSNSAYRYDANSNRFADYGYNSYDSQAGRDAINSQRPKRLELANILDQANPTMQANEAAKIAAIKEQANATYALKLASEAAKQAIIDYASATQDFVIDASKSVGKLSKLREETVKYYEAQSKLADLMQTSAAGIRSTIAAYTFSQKTSEQQYQDLAGQFSTAFTMTQVTTGEELASYGDKLNALINPLIESLTATGRDNLIASYLAQAELAAVNVDNGITALGDYQQDSLDMLGSIDATLAVLDASSQSAEKIISEAVKAGSDLTAAGLRAVVAALTGSEIPAFASGGTHQGGVRLVGENGPELEITGPSRIYNAGQTQGMFGPRESGTANLLHSLLQSNADMSAELRAIATATVKTARLIDRAMPEGDAISTRAVTA
jgi:hypothetical protein